MRTKNDTARFFSRLKERESMSIQPLDLSGARREWARVRRTNPLVHCMTNAVACAFTADVLAAAGASPAMLPAKEEAPDFTRIAAALLVNVGTLTAPDADAMLLTTRAALYAKKPWVLDPVAAGVSLWRDSVIAKLVLNSPTVIRGNPSEIVALSGGEKTAKGVDSILTSADALEAAQTLDSGAQTIVAVTGQVDYITDGTRTLSVAGGNAKVGRIVGTGCSLSALVAAFIAGADDLLVAAASACALAKTAAQTVGDKPYGSFHTAYLDAIETVSLQAL